MKEEKQVVAPSPFNSGFKFKAIINEQAFIFVTQFVFFLTLTASKTSRRLRRPPYDLIGVAFLLSNVNTGIKISEKKTIKLTI